MEITIIIGLVIVLCVLIICITAYEMKKINLEETKKIYRENMNYLQDYMRDSFGSIETISDRIEHIDCILQELYSENKNEKNN